MRNFKQDSNRDSRDIQRHSAVCDSCGKDCKVPFKPTSGKPIYCSDCFGKQGGRETSRRAPKRESSQVLEKLDKIIELLTSRQRKK